ncbi:MAG: type I phosphomannose isomerase catalytic subunit [Thermomicrobiales bacterium]
MKGEAVCLIKTKLGEKPMPEVSIVVPRLDTKPWGGRRLEQYGFELPPETPIGEALVTSDDAQISAGFGAGATLGAVIGADPAGRLGALAATAVGNRQVFPLLVKLIDASENLSIQVHPNDMEAVELGRLGKTEAWHVRAADPGAKLYVGLQPSVSLEEFADVARKLDGSSSTVMRALDAVPGMTLLIPAGTIHALGGGVMVYEIQQPSDVTFRLDDWGRVDAQGRPREMHIDQGFRVALPDMRPEPIIPIALEADTGERQLLVACRYFALERLTIPAGAAIDLGAADSPQVLTVLSGDVNVSGDEAVGTLAPGHSAVMWPAGSGGMRIEASVLTPVVALRSWVPDLKADVVEPARRTGAGDDAIAAIGAPLVDVRDAIG